MRNISVLGGSILRSVLLLTDKDLKRNLRNPSSCHSTKMSLDTPQEEQKGVFLLPLLPARYPGLGSAFKPSNFDPFS